MQVKKQQLEWDMEQQTGSKLETEYVKAIYCNPAYLTYMQEYIMRNAGLDEAQAGIKFARRNISSLRYTDDTTLMAGIKEELKSPMMHVKEESKKAGICLLIFCNIEFVLTMLGLCCKMEVARTSGLQSSISY